MYKKLIVVAALAVALTGIGSFGATVAADGNGSPVACNGNPNVNPNAANVLSSKTGSDDEVVVDAGAGNTVTGVCIRSGSAMFTDGHSEVLGNGIYEENCYEVSGVGTQVVTVKRLRDARDCQGISHIDVLFSKKPITDNPDEPTDPEEPTTPDEEGEVLGDSTTTPQVSATPTGGVSAGGGAVAGAFAGLASSIAAAGYGFARLKARR